ncbi:MAG: Mu-like prophage major head subunit gpT family protein [Cycloclasticus sp.]
MKKIKYVIWSLLACIVIAACAGPVFASPEMGVGAVPLEMGSAIGMLGMLVNSASIKTIFTGLKTIFNQALKAKTGEWQKTTMEVPSSAAGEDYAWLSRFPRFRKWVGDKQIKNIAAGKYYVKNEDWEATVAVDRNHIEDDRLGIYNIQAQSAGDSAAELHDIISDDLKNNAFVNTCLDGQYFYDTDHDVNGASVSNKMTKALSNATLALAEASIGAARVAIGKLTDEEGAPLRMKADLLEVPPALETIANMLANSDKLADDTPNPYKGTFTVLVNPGLVSDTAWFLHVTTNVVKPFIVQMRKRPVFVNQTSMENDDVFNKREYKFGAEARATGAYGLWQLSHGSTGTT